jgi:PAS domain S-box-containing protein
MDHVMPYVLLIIWRPIMKEKNLIKAESYDSFLEMSVEGMMVIDKSMIIQITNPGAALILEYEKDELPGKNILELIPAEKHAEFQNLCADFLKSGKRVAGRKTVLPFFTKKKNIIEAETSLGNHIHSEEGPLLILVFSDITEKTRKEIKLRESEEQFSFAFHLSPAPSAITRLSDGIYKDVNNAFLKVFGYERDQVVGKTSTSLNLYKHCGNEQRQILVERIEREGAIRDVEITFNTYSGKPIEVLFSAQPVMLIGEKHLLSTMIDITEKKKLRRDLERLNGDLEQKIKDRTLDLTTALEREKGINEIKSRFVTMASHEFRTPLATILSSISLLEKYTATLSDQKITKHFERIKSAVSNLTEILNEFISLEKIEKGKVEIQNQQFSLTALVNDGISQLKERLKKGQEINYSYSGDNTLFQDETKVLNAVLNLISNAIKYSPEDSTIQVTSEVKDGFATVTVKDQGIGIPEQDQENLFSLFFRARNADIIQGTGLGLCIVKNYMELMGGNINFTSRLDKGSTFVIKFPSNAGT